MRDRPTSSPGAAARSAGSGATPALPRAGVVSDVAVGVVFGLLAGSNLVQGAWLADVPWLDLTTAAFALAVPIALAGLRRRTTVKEVAAILLLMAALVLGYLEPALSADATHKRTNLVVGVAFVFVASYLSLSNPRRLRSFFVTVACLAVPVVVGQVVVPDGLALATGRRTPVGVNAIGAGRAVGSALVLVLALLVFPRRGRRRLPLALLAIVLATSLYLAGSRGPVVGVLVAALLLIWKHPSLRRPPKAALLVALAVLAALAYRRSASAASRLADLTTSGRGELYAQAVRIAGDHPLGIGWGNFYRFAPAALLNSDQGDNLYAHNILLEFWIEAGAVAALLFTAVAVMILAMSFRGATLSAPGLALAALLVNLLAGAMLSSDVIGNRMLWVVLAAVLAGAAGRTVAPAQRRHGTRRRGARRQGRRPA
jgi:O-antigen ligase